MQDLRLLWKALGILIAVCAIISFIQPDSLFEWAFIVAIVFRTPLWRVGKWLLERFHDRRNLRLYFRD